jgi:hypothetical protein
LLHLGEPFYFIGFAYSVYIMVKEKKVFLRACSILSAAPLCCLEQSESNNRLAKSTLSWTMNYVYNVFVILMLHSKLRSPCAQSAPTAPTAPAFSLRLPASGFQPPTSRQLSLPCPLLRSHIKVKIIYLTISSWHLLGGRSMATTSTCNASLSISYLVSSFPGIYLLDLPSLPNLT